MQYEIQFEQERRKIGICLKSNVTIYMHQAQKNDTQKNSWKTFRCALSHRQAILYLGAESDLI